MVRLSTRIWIVAVSITVAALAATVNKPAHSFVRPLAAPVVVPEYLHDAQIKRRVKFKRRSRGGSLAELLAKKGSAKLEIAQPVDGPNDSLFNTSEKRFTKFTPFKKWTGAMEKMDREQANMAVFKQKFGPWLGYFDSLKGKSGKEQLDAVNSFMNRSRYVQDIRNWGVKDYWESPGEFMAKFGDCEDYSISKYMALKYLGWDLGKLRVVVVKDLNLKIGHAILAAYFDEKIFILDNQIKVVADSRRIKHYKPVYSINEKFWWRHRKSA